MKELTARAQIWVHSSEYSPHVPVEFSACEWYGHLSMLEAFLETHPGDLDVDPGDLIAGLRMDEWLDVELRFSYEEADGSGDFCLQEIKSCPLPSSERIEELEQQLRDAGDAMAIQDERIEELRGALEELVDSLAGPPPLTMSRALQALGREPGDE